VGGWSWSGEGEREECGEGAENAEHGCEVVGCCLAGVGGVQFEWVCGSSWCSVLVLLFAAM
jgi:hypothetical protein